MFKNKRLKKKSRINNRPRTLTQTKASKRRHSGGKQQKD